MNTNNHEPNNSNPSNDPKRETAPLAPGTESKPADKTEVDKPAAAPEPVKAETVPVSNR